MALPACAYAADYIQQFKGNSDTLKINIRRRSADMLQLYFEDLHGQSELVEFTLDKPDLSDSLCTLGD
jgi:hypothetical protein